MTDSCSPSLLLASHILVPSTLPLSAPPTTSLTPSWITAAPCCLYNEARIGHVRVYDDTSFDFQADIICSSGKTRSYVMLSHFDDDSNFINSSIRLNEVLMSEAHEETTPTVTSVLFSAMTTPRGGGTSPENRHNTRQDAELAPVTSAETLKNLTAAENSPKQKHQITSTSSTKEDRSQNQPNHIIWISSKRLRTVAKKVIDRTTSMLGFRKIPSYTENIQVDSSEDHEFTELDSIMENSSLTNHFKDERRWLDDTEWLASDTSPPKEASTLKGWNKRSLRAWINKIERKFLSNETTQAIKTIRKILESFPEYGVVDLLGLYSPQDVILSIISLSRLQRVVEYCNSRDSSRGSATVDSIDDAIAIKRETLEDLARYAKFAHAAYGWKGLAAFCGRFHFGGDYRALIKRTGIHRRDILMANWHSRTNRPAFFLVDDVERKAIVLSIRGTMSPRDILTDLCASCENFFVEDKSEVVEIGDIECDDGRGYANSSLSTIMVGRAHKGMVYAAKSISKMTGKIITDELRSKADYSLVIVGHSLGGGVAAVLTTMWKRRFAGKIQCYGYGMPCVFPVDDGQDPILSLIGEGDPFSVISLGHLADITKALSQLCQDKSFRDEILQRTRFGKLTSLKDIPDSDLLFSINALNCLRKHMTSEKLYPPGTIYLMEGSLFNFNVERYTGNQERDSGKIRRVESSHFNELKLHARMFDLSYHIPARYEVILERLLSYNSS